MNDLVLALVALQSPLAFSTTMFLYLLFVATPLASTEHSISAHFAKTVLSSFGGGGILCPALIGGKTAFPIARWDALPLTALAVLVSRALPEPSVARKRLQLAGFELFRANVMRAWLVNSEHLPVAGRLAVVFLAGTGGAFVSSGSLNVLRSSTPPVAIASGALAASLMVVFDVELRLVVLTLIFARVAFDR